MIDLIPAGDIIRVHEIVVNHLLPLANRRPGVYTTDVLVSKFCELLKLVLRCEPGTMFNEREAAKEAGLPDGYGRLLDEEEAFVKGLNPKKKDENGNLVYALPWYGPALKPRVEYIKSAMDRGRIVPLPADMRELVDVVNLALFPEEPN